MATQELLGVDRCAGPDTTVREAMAMITDTHQGLLPVIDGDGRLIGVITDGDIRRGLLGNLNFSDGIAPVINRSPIIGRIEDEEHELQSLMRTHNKSCIPVVDDRGRYLRLAYYNRKPIPNCVPCVDGREQAYAAEAIGNGWLAIGPFIERFERAICEYTGARHAVALSNGTAALHLGLLAAGVRPGDLVLVPTMTFVATANAVKFCGADPVFFDVEPGCWAIDVDQVRVFLKNDCTRISGQLAEKRSGRRIGAVMPVDLYGHPADHDAISELAQHYDIPVVEDAAEALGAKYKGQRVGAKSRICCLSFNGNKIITGGNGGMVLTDDEAVARQIRYFSAQAKDDPVEFVHGAVGYNYRMPNVNAAIALAQAERLDEFIERKRRFVADYDSCFSKIDGISMWREMQWAESSCWMSVLTVDEASHPDAIGKLRRFLPAQGIEARPVWLPLHRQKPFADCISMPIKVAERIYRTSLCLPCSTGLTRGELETVANVVVNVFKS